MTARGPLPKRPASDGRGNSHRPPKNITFIEPIDGPPPPPDLLGKHGQEAWIRYWATADWLVESDRGGVYIICSLLDHIEDMRAIVDRDGRTVAGSKGQPVTHPLNATINQCVSLMVGLMSDYGFTPAGRRRLGIEVKRPHQAGPLDRYMARRSERDERDPYAHLRTDA